MKTLELFSGTKSFSKVAKSRGHDTITVDIEEELNPDIVANLLYPSTEVVELIRDSSIIWMSPPCTSFSMASGSKHWSKDRQAKTKEAEEGYNLLAICEGIAEYCEEKGKIFFIENPRARARWFLPKRWRSTVWYCQYGDDRAKPTDIWTNLKGWQPKTCKNNNSFCKHEKAPRGSRSGTQGKKGAKDRGEVPAKLCEELLMLAEKQLKKTDVFLRG